MGFKMCVDEKGRYGLLIEPLENTIANPTSPILTKIIPLELRSLSLHKGEAPSTQRRCWLDRTIKNKRGAKKGIFYWRKETPWHLLSGYHFQVHHQSLNMERFLT